MCEGSLFFSRTTSGHLYVYASDTTLMTSPTLYTRQYLDPTVNVMSPRHLSRAWQPYAFTVCSKESAPIQRAANLQTKYTFAHRDTHHCGRFSLRSSRAVQPSFHTMGREASVRYDVSRPYIAPTLFHPRRGREQERASSIPPTPTRIPFPREATSRTGARRHSRVTHSLGSCATKRAAGRRSCLS